MFCPVPPPVWLPVSAPGTAADAVSAPGPLPPTWEIKMKFLALDVWLCPGPDLATVATLGMSQRMKDLSYSLPLCDSVFQRKKKSFKNSLWEMEVSITLF